MKNIFKTEYDEEIQRVIARLTELDPSSEDYKKASEALKNLSEARSKRAASLIDANSALAILSNILGIVLILNYEQLHVLNTRAFQLLKK